MRRIGSRYPGEASGEAADSPRFRAVCVDQRVPALADDPPQGVGGGEIVSRRDRPDEGQGEDLHAGSPQFVGEGTRRAGDPHGDASNRKFLGKNLDLVSDATISRLADLEDFHSGRYPFSRSAVVLIHAGAPSDFA